MAQALLGHTCAVGTETSLFQALAGIITWSWGKGGGPAAKSWLRGGAPLLALPLLAAGTPGGLLQPLICKTAPGSNALVHVDQCLPQWGPSLLAMIPLGTQSQGLSSLVYGSWNSAWSMAVSQGPEKGLVPNTKHQGVWAEHHCPAAGQPLLPLPEENLTLSLHWWRSCLLASPSWHWAEPAS